jgi:putative ABC transport system permease protein
MSQQLHLAWKQLTFQRMKLVAALSGVMVAVMLMWIQLGILASLYNAATLVHRNLQADLVIVSPLFETMNQVKSLSTRILYRARGCPGVVAIGELLIGPVEWRNPITGEKKQIQAYGLEPEEGWVDLPGISQYAPQLRAENTFLYDRRSRNVFGPVVKAVERGEAFHVELNHRKMVAVGLTSMAATFGQQGNLVTSRANFLRTHPGHPPHQVHVGLVRTRQGENVESIQAALRNMFGNEALVMTPSEFAEFELRFWKTNAPVGFIFTMGTAVGFLIGFIVVYQILYADVTHHLPYYATMKAMGFADWYLLLLVIRQGLILSVLGYIPGSLLAIGFYQVIQYGTSIPVGPTWERAGFLLVLTILMCFLSGVVATQRLRSADPADVF